MMDRDVKNTLGTISQWVSLAVQCYVIIGVVMMVFTFEERAITCFYYRLPLIYNSLEIIRSLPIITLIFLFIFHTIVWSYAYLFSIKVERIAKLLKKEASDADSDFFTFVNEVFFNGEIRKLVPEFVLTLRKKMKNKAAGKAKKQLNSRLLLFFIIIIEVPSSIIWGWYTSSTSSRGIYTYWDIIGGVGFLAVTIIKMMLLGKCFIELIKNYANYEKEREINSASNHKYQQRTNQLRKETALFCLLVIITASSWVTTSTISHLVDNLNYDIVEIIVGGESKSCAVIIDLNEFYLLQPIEEKNDELIINTLQYMYVEKNNIIVTRKSFSKVTVDRKLDLKIRWGFS